MSNFNNFLMLDIINVLRYNDFNMKMTMTKEQLQEMTLDYWIQEGIFFTDKMYKEGRLNVVQFWMETGEYTVEDWKEDKELKQWAKEILEDEQKMFKELGYSEGEVTIA